MRAEIRGALARLEQPPDSARFSEAWASLSALEGALVPDEARALEARLEGWPDEACRAPEGWLDDLDTPARALLRVLWLGGGFCTPAPFEQLEALPRVAPQLRALTITQLQEARIEASLELLQRADLSALRSLQLIYTPEALPFLERARLPALTHFSFESALPPSAWARLLGAPWIPQLTALSLRGDGLAGQLERLPASPRLARLSLDAEDDPLTPSDVEALERCPALISLDLELARVDEGTIRALIGSSLPRRLEALELDPEEEEAAPIPDDLKRALYHAGWAHPQPRDAVWRWRYDFFTDHRRRLRAEEIARRLHDEGTRDFSEALRAVCWVHVDHRSALIEQLSQIQRWSPGPLECMRVSPFDDRASDILSTHLRGVTALLIEWARDLEPSLESWLGGAERLLMLKTDQKGKEPPTSFHRWARRGSLEDDVSYKLIGLVRWSLIRDHYVEWKRQARFTDLAEALIARRAEAEGRPREEIQRRLEQEMIPRLLEELGNDWEFLTRLPSRRVHAADEPSRAPSGSQ